MPWNHDDMQRAIDLYEVGHPLTRAADQSGVPKATLYRCLKDAGKMRTRSEAQRLRRHDPRSPEGRARRRRIRQAVRLFQETGSREVVAAELDVTARTVSVYLKTDLAREMAGGCLLDDPFVRAEADVTRAQLVRIREQLDAAPRGEKCATVERWAHHLGVSRPTVRRYLRDLI